MNEMENEDSITQDFDIEDESFECRLPKRKITKVKKSLSDLRSPRQKFCQRWVTEFSWLKPDKVDESLGYCRVCSKVLVCKKSHLERHQKSYKHQRLGGMIFDQDAEENTDAYPDTDIDVNAVNDEPEPSATEFLECGKREQVPEFEFENAIEVDTDIKLEPHNAVAKKEETFKNFPQRNMIRKQILDGENGTHIHGSESSGLDRLKLLKRIDRDRHELNIFYYARQKQKTPPSAAQTPANTRDSFDLFFDSVSASVKTLPPKLAAEVKSRVSQIMAEFELRAICEREALENAAASTEPPVIVASTSHEIVSNGAECEPTVIPNIVYSFQK